ncbi:MULTISPECIES: hypothetical protein [unclassified Lysobacter]
MILDYMLGHSPLVLIALTALAVVAFALAQLTRLGRRRDRRR